MSNEQPNNDPPQTPAAIDKDGHAYSQRPTTTQSVVSSFSVGARHYEARLNDCGKINCQKCGGSGRRQPSHGPYWYLCTMVRGQWRRIYLGKELDTSRFVTPEGKVDWTAIRAARAAGGRRNSADAHSEPGQADAFENPPSKETPQ